MRKELVLALIASLLLAGCGSTSAATSAEPAETATEATESASEDTASTESTAAVAEEPTISEYARELKYRRMPTATSDLFEEGVAPILEAEGYTLTPVEITDSVQRELALAEGDIDFHVDANKAYLDKTNDAQGTNLVPALQIPTVPTGIYPGSKDDLADIADGDTIAFPDDPANEARALHLLQDAGLITMDENVTPTDYTLADIVENPYNLAFTEMAGGNIPSVRGDFSYIILRGSDAYNGGIDFDTALAAESAESILDDSRMTICINGDNADEGWVQDLVDAYQSEEFKAFMETQSDIWILPDYLVD